MNVSRRRYMGGSAAHPIPYEEQYLTFTSLEDNNTISITSSETSATIKHLYVSTDGGETWGDESFGTTSSQSVDLATLNSGQKVLIKGSNGTYSWISSSHYCYFSSTKAFKAEGNIMSIVSGDDFIGNVQLYVVRALWKLFLGCTTLMDVENLILPATTLVGSCYHSMFRDCTSIQKAPVLPATTVPTQSYRYMFNGCASLSYIKCLATSSAYATFGDWVSGVAASGTFVKNASASSSFWASGASGIPSGWTVETATI